MNPIKLGPEYDARREEATARMFASSKDWPNLFLPVKNYNLPDLEYPGLPLLGIILSTELPLVIHQTEMYRPDFKNCKKHRFESVQKAMAAGWVVD